MTLRTGACVALALVACGCGKTRRAARDVDGGPRAAAAEPAAPFWADRPEPALRTLGAALEKLSPDDVRDWLRLRELPDPEGVPPEEPSVEIQAAVDALVAWDGAGLQAPMPCSKGFGNPLPFRLTLVAKSAFELADGPSAPPARAALRMGLALRASDNDALAMVVGAAIQKEATRIFARREIAAPIPAPFAIADDLPWRVLESSARCTIWTLETLDPASPEAVEMMEVFGKMGRKPEQALVEETQAVKAFWAETLRQAAAVRTRAELAAIVERRIDEARASRPRSMLVPLLGAPFVAKSALDD